MSNYISSVVCIVIHPKKAAKNEKRTHKKASNRIHGANPSVAKIKTVIAGNRRMGSFQTVEHYD